jgi:hypothetical protein
MVTDQEPQPLPLAGQPPLAGTELTEEGGDSACWARLVCPECGAMTTEGHRPGCEFSPQP